MSKQVLLIGSGGREHALAWKLSQSTQVSKIYCAPGNGGTAGESKCCNVELKADDIQGILNWLTSTPVDLVVVGPELPLSLGLVDAIQKINIPVFGPMQAAAELETSKAYAKQFMQKHSLPTAKFDVFTNQQAAYDFCMQHEWARVIKLDGLAAGKGVFVCDTLQDCKNALETLYANEAETKVVVEEKLIGPEVSLFLVCDGNTIYPMQLAQDYKRRFENNNGPNTGGMGSFSPVEWATPYQEIIRTQVIEPLEKALQHLNPKFCGLLFVGLLLHEEKPYILEFNVRFGDPETQSILPALNTDFYELLFQTATGQLQAFLNNTPPQFSKLVNVCVNLIHEEYPAKSGSGEAITIGKVPENVQVFHAGTILKDNQLQTNGGRILSVVASAVTHAIAVEKAYQAIQLVQYNQMAFRKDIGTLYNTPQKELVTV